MLKIKRYFYFYLTFFILFYNPTFAKITDKCKGKTVCLIVEQNVHKYDLIAINTTTRPVSVNIHLEQENIKSNKNFPLLVILNSKVRRKIAQFKTDNLLNQSNFKLSYSWMYGSFKIKKSTFIYKLPYKISSSYVVGQGFNTKKTHSNLNKYSIDWNMPENTEIYAARSGYVVEVKEDSNETGTTKEYLNKANYIKILHQDGSFAVYAHLKHNGVIVKKGTFVSQGKLIGYSGNTGFSTGPHLHFHVGRPHIYKEKMTEITIPFKFSNCKQRIPFVPIVGKKYKSC